jgi:chitodextrinase
MWDAATTCTSRGRACYLSLLLVLAAATFAAPASARTDNKAPTKPSSLKITNATTQSISLSWQRSKDNVGVVGYRVYLNGSLKATVQSTSYTFTNLSCGSTNTLGVQSYDAAGNKSVLVSVVASTLPCPDLSSPTAPTNLSETSATQSTISLSWTASSDNVGVADYDAYRGGVPVGTTPSTAYTFSGLTCGQSYSLGVDAVDAAGNKSLPATVQASTSPCPDTTPPTVPNYPVVTATTSSSVTLSWMASLDDVGVAGYDVYVNGTRQGATSATYYVFAALGCGQTYTLGVDAYDAAGNRSGQASVITATSTCPDTQPPTAPTGLSQTGTSATSVSVSWSPSSDNTRVTGYAVYVNGTSAGSTANTSYSASGLSCGTAYTVGVEAYDAAGNHSTRATVSASTSPCAQTPSPGAVALPVAPQSYSLPASYVSVSTSQQLVNALASSTAHDIVLADGSYTTAGTTSATPYFQASTGHRLYAQHLGQAVLQAGLVFGGNSGSGNGEAHGLAFNVSDPARTYDAAELYTWGANGVGTKVYDSTFEGNYALDYGLEFKQVQGAVVQRVLIKHFHEYGLFVSDCCDYNWYDNTAEAQTITDVDVDGVHEAVPGSDNGRAEYGVWIGNGVVDPVARLRIEHAWWSGLWTGSSSHDTVFTDITISTVDRPDGNAIYNEHNTVRDTFQRFKLGPYIQEGFTCEWNYGSGSGACANSVFQDGTIDSRKAGVFLDQGQVGNTVRRITFLNQTCAAIVDNQGVGNSYSDNDFTGLAAGAVQVKNYCY